MRNFFYNAMIKLQRFMYGRYGTDRLSLFMTIIATVFMVLSFFGILWFLYFIGLALMILSVLRGFSRNISARQKELGVYMRIRGKITGRFSLFKRKWKERKTHKYLKCPKCRANLRVPKGKGKITITCAKCGTKFDKKT